MSACGENWRRPRHLTWIRLLSAPTSLLFALTAQIHHACADQESPPHYGWQEMWTGVDAAGEDWLVYSGMSIAPWSTDIYSDGLRLRIGGGYGKQRYDFSTLAPISMPCGQGGKTDACEYEEKRHRGARQYSYAEALVGYHMRLGELTAKAFAGASTITTELWDQVARQFKPKKEVGFKASVELWLNIGANAWSSLDAGYTIAHDTASLRWRAGWRPWSNISIGPELRYDRSGEYSSDRAGVFIRYEWIGGEISAAAGVANILLDDGPESTDLDNSKKDYDAELTPYATLNLVLQF